MSDDEGLAFVFASALTCLIECVIMFGFSLSHCHLSVHGSRYNFNLFHCMLVHHVSIVFLLHVALAQLAPVARLYFNASVATFPGCAFFTPSNCDPCCTMRTLYISTSLCVQPPITRHGLYCTVHCSAQCVVRCHRTADVHRRRPSIHCHPMPPHFPLTTLSPPQMIHVMFCDASEPGTARASTSSRSTPVSDLVAHTSQLC